MSVTFVGNTKWQVVAELEWSVSDWDIASVTQTWRGPRTGKTAAENSFQRWLSLGVSPFAGMRLQKYNSKNSTPSFPAIDVTYVGFRGGIPPPKTTPSISAQSIQVTGTDSSTGQTFTATFQYRAARTTWEWWELSTPNPSTPRYATVVTNQPPQITGYIITDQSGDTTIPATTLTSAFNKLVATAVLSSYEPEPIVPNAIYKCKSVVDFMFTGS